MSNYAAKWKTAKNTFETNTGKKKPKATKQGLFDKTTSKRSGVADLLKAVDKLVPDDLSIPVSDKAIDKVNKAVNAIKAAGGSYVRDIEAAIDKEKEEFGKEASAVYRDLKILRAELDAVISGIVNDQAKMYAAREAARKEISDGVKWTFLTLKTVGEGIEKTCKEGVVWAQTVLKDPTPQNYNSGILTKARNITQNFTQIVKFTVPEEASQSAQASRLRTMEDPKIADLVAQLDRRVTAAKAGAVPISKETGTDPFDSSLGKMGNSPERLPDTASADDVTRAVKHFLSQVKAALVVRKTIW